MRLSDFRWLVSGCGEPIGTFWAAGDGPGTYANSPQRGLRALFFWTEDDAQQHLSNMHRLTAHGEFCYLD
jgi:hypothetical protein